MCAEYYEEPDEEKVVLAERRSKEHWSLDPRNTFWSNDKKRFGYKMLTRMGWSDGKGLGVNEDGHKKHISITKKDNNLGLGAKKSNDDEWISHQDSFNSLLSELNDVYSCNVKESTAMEPEKPETNNLLSAACKSKKLHYHKFIKSKDLSMKSDKDLACVFGRRGSKRCRTDYDDDASLIQKPEVISNDTCTFNGITTVRSNLDIEQYFASKQQKQKEETSASKKVKKKKRKG